MGRGKGFKFQGNTTLSAKVLRNADFIKTAGTVFGVQAGVFANGSTLQQGILKSQNLFEKSESIECKAVDPKD
jgi:hypothetical protein